jgi:hypothetical protein
MFSFFEVPKDQVLKKIETFMSRYFFFKNEGQKKKYHLTKWNVLCTPKDQGGMCILNLKYQNDCLLSKWLFRLLNSEGTWQTIIWRKYLTNKTLTQVEYVSRNSHFWPSLMNIKGTFLNFGSFVIGDGSQLRFWEDSRYGQQNFKDGFSNLYSIV